MTKQEGLEADLQKLVALKERKEKTEREIDALESKIQEQLAKYGIPIIKHIYPYTYTITGTTITTPNSTISWPLVSSGNNNLGYWYQT